MAMKLDISGRPNPKLSHGMRMAPEYQVWCQMKLRCNKQTNNEYPNYGGRGIKVCESWNESFEAFYADMGNRPSEKYSLDRIDNNGMYSPENCRWVTALTQASNRRSNRKITCNGETLTVSEWARRLGTKRQIVLSRLATGWPDEKAVSTPVATRNKRNA
jgi:hypothetical protein